MENVDILIFKHDVPELLDGVYSEYGNDGSLIEKIDHVVVSEENKKFLSTSKSKAVLGSIVSENGTHRFVRK